MTADLEKSFKTKLRTIAKEKNRDPSDLWQNLTLERFLVRLAHSLFYADFKHFQQYGVSITGARYVHLEYGPCPDQFQNIYQLFVSKGILISGGYHVLKSFEKPDLSVFSDSEREILEFVALTASKDGGKKLLKVSHEEQAFKKTEPLRLISYEYSKELKI